MKSLVVTIRLLGGVIKVFYITVSREGHAPVTRYNPDVTSAFFSTAFTSDRYYRCSKHPEIVCCGVISNPACDASWTFTIPITNSMSYNGSSGKFERNSHTIICPRVCQLATATPRYSFISCPVMYGRNIFS